MVQQQQIMATMDNEITKDLDYYKDLVSKKGYSQRQVAIGLSDYMHHNTVKSYFSGLSVNKTNQKVIETYIETVEPSLQLKTA